ncbi:MAG: ATP-binding protein [Leptospiraceae bacterium]|nr:ATP-binding protein [Leptospiraceae bacterium]
MKLPIGIQSFESIRKDNYYYVDKTKYIYRLVNEGKPYFLSRPRRFGKSLFLDTLKQAFLGKKELFEGLYLEKNWDWSKQYPVIHIDFGGGMLQKAESLTEWILEQLTEISKYLGLTLKRKEVRYAFREIILQAQEVYKERVVILIDEYDKPILDLLEYKEEAIQAREILKNFYSVLKPLDSHLKFLFITGVSKFSKVSLFSGLNQLYDISLDEKYSGICGYTEKELQETFAKELDSVNMQAIREWYNGYNFLGESVYNPFDILLYFAQKKFHPFWFESGTPTFLIQLLLNKNFFIPNLEEIVATENIIGSFDVDFIEPENLLFQTGYLTIKNYETIPTGYVYYLSYPNKEVKISLNRYILDSLTQLKTEVPRLNLELYKILKSAHLNELQKIFISLFTSIPYEWYRRNEISKYEGYYASVVYSFFAGAGLEIIAEDFTNKGRIDLSVFYEGKCFILEFKVSEKDSFKAIEQVRKNSYHTKYLSKASEIYLIGIDFDPETKSIVNFEWERI